MSDIIVGQKSLELVAGEVVFKAQDGETVIFSVKDGNLSLGGDGRDGDLMIHDKTGSLTIALNGERGALHLGGSGQDGDFTVRDKDFEQTAHLDGRLGDLDIKGRLTCQSLSQLSDARLKENIAPIDDALAAVQNLNGVRYAFKSNPSATRLGVIAQDVASAAPEAIHDTPQGLAVDQAALTGLLIEAVKTLSAEVEALKASGAKTVG